MTGERKWPINMDNDLQPSGPPLTDEELAAVNSNAVIGGPGTTFPWSYVSHRVKYGQISYRFVFQTASGWREIPETGGTPGDLWLLRTVILDVLNELMQESAVPRPFDLSDTAVFDDGRFIIREVAGFSENHVVAEPAMYSIGERGERDRTRPIDTDFARLWQLAQQLSGQLREQQSRRGRT